MVERGRVARGEGQINDGFWMGALTDWSVIGSGQRFISRKRREKKREREKWCRHHEWGRKKEKKKKKIAVKEQESKEIGRRGERETR